MDLQQFGWNGYEKTETLSQLYGFSKRHMARLLKDWKERGTVVHMKAFYPNDYRLFDIWQSMSPETIRRIIENEQEIEECIKTDQGTTFSEG